MSRILLKRRSGFSLTEMAIVLAIGGVILGAVWLAMGAGRQNVRIEQAQEDLNALVNGTRAAYASQVKISGDVWTVLPYLVQTQSIGQPIIRPAASACNGISSNYADTPWPAAYDVCGSLRVCAWSYGVNTGCRTPAISAGAQFFAAEFQQLDYASCVAFVTKVTPALPPGLQDVYLNGNSVVATAGTAMKPLPVPPMIAESRGAYVGKGCSSSLPNIIDFVYALRAPVN